MITRRLSIPYIFRWKEFLRELFCLIYCLLFYLYIYLFCGHPFLTLISMCLPLFYFHDNRVNIYEFFINDNITMIHFWKCYLGFPDYLVDRTKLSPKYIILNTFSTWNGLHVKLTLSHVGDVSWTITTDSCQLLGYCVWLVCILYSQSFVKWHNILWEG